MSAAKKTKLGRGLDALLGLDATAAADGGEAGGELRNLAVGVIQPGRYQPRTGMDPERLQELADSIKAQGLIQPIIVRGIGPGRYEIIAGERRWRAARRAGLTVIPAVVREMDDREMLEIAIIENVQRADLNAVEEAEAYKSLIDRFGRTQESVAQQVGKSREHVSNTMRLLQLPDDVREHVRELAVVGQYEQARGRGIQSTDIEQALLVDARVLAQVTAGGESGVAHFDVIYTPGVPATWAGFREADCHSVLPQQEAHLRFGL